MKLVVGALVLVAALLGANYYFLVQHAGGPLGCLPCAAILLGGPLVIGGLLGAALLGGGHGRVEVPAPRPYSDVPARDAFGASGVVSGEEAVRLLTALQQEGRLIDFLTEDISRYSDADVGATTRRIQQTCGGALRSLIGLEPVLAGREDDEVTLEAGFDAAAIRLVGNVQGDPPYRGVIRHTGWRAVTNGGGLVIAPAEVEVVAPAFQRM